MSVFESIASTVLKVRVDGVSEAKSQLKSLQGTEKEVAEARVSGLEAGNSAMESWVKGMGYAAVAIGAVKVGMEAMEAYAHRLDLQATTTGISIEKLAVAAKGLKTNSELLEHAAALTSGTFKLTQSQLEQVEGAMYTLEERGKSSSEVWSAMEAALTKGSIKPLMSLGVVIHDTGNLFDENGGKLDSYAKRQEALAQILKGIVPLAEDAKQAHLDAGDAMNKEIVTLKNLWDDAKIQLGKFVTELTPAVAMLAQAAKDVQTIANMVPKNMRGGGLDVFSHGGGGSMWDATGGQIDWNYLGGFFRNGVTNDPLDPNTISGRENLKRSNDRRWQAFMSAIQNGMGAGKASATGDSMWGTDGGGDGAFDAGSFATFSDTWAKKLGLNLSDSDKRKLALQAEQMAALAILRGAQVEKVQGQGGAGLGLLNTSDILNGRSALGSRADTTPRDAYGAPIDLEDTLGTSSKAMTADWFAKVNAHKAKEKSFLESTFGPVGDFNIYAQAFQTLTGAVTAGLDAWIDGSVSAGEAIKKFIGTALKGLASQMAVEALKHGAYAIGSLAFGDIAGASAHGAAAIAFATGAAAAAVAAKEMGGGGASVPKASGAGASGGTGGGSHASSGGGSSGGGKQQPIINNFIVGDWFANQSLRERQREAERTVKLATGGSVGQDS